MSDDGFPEWMDKTELQAVGVVTLKNGEKMTAEIVEYDEDRRELVLDLISPKGEHSNGVRKSIPVDDIADFEPQPREAQQWPYSDPCRQKTSFARFALMATLFLCWTVGSIPLFLFFVERPFGVQEASAISYTIFVVWVTFAATRQLHKFLFTCPAVKPEIPRLLLRHLAFLVALFCLQTAALTVRPNLPAWWNTEDAKGRPPFVPLLGLACMSLGFVEIYSSRAILERAHKEFSA